jgi:hypothetical protein
MAHSRTIGFRRAGGEKVFDIIETTPDRLREVDGIARKAIGVPVMTWMASAPQVLKIRTARAVPTRWPCKKPRLRAPARYLLCSSRSP